MYDPSKAVLNVIDRVHRMRVEFEDGKVKDTGCYGYMIF